MRPHVDVTIRRALVQWWRGRATVEQTNRLLEERYLAEYAGSVRFTTKGNRVLDRMNRAECDELAGAL